LIEGCTRGGDPTEKRKETRDTFYRAWGMINMLTEGKVEGTRGTDLLFFQKAGRDENNKGGREERKRGGTKISEKLGKGSANIGSEKCVLIVLQKQIQRFASKTEGGCT